MNPIQRPDFSLKNAIDPNVVMEAVRNKITQESAAKAQQQRDEFAAIQGAIKTTSDVVTQMVDQSREKQKREFVKSWANWLGQTKSVTPNAAQATLFQKPAEGIGPNNQMQVPTASFDPQQQEAISAAVQANPKPFLEDFSNSLFPKVATGAAGANNFTAPIAFVNTKSGQRMMAQFDKQGNGRLQDGSPITADWVKDYAPATGKDQFNNPIVIPKSGNQPATPVAVTGQSDIASGGGIPELQTKAPVLAERFVKARDDAYPQNNAVIKVAAESASSAAQAKAMLKQKDKIEVGLKSLGFYFARASGSNSQLSDAEREQFEAPLSLLERYKNKGYRAIAGELSPKMNNDLVRLADLIERKNKLIGNKAINAAKANAKAQVGSLWNESLSKEFPSIDDFIATDVEIGQIPQASDPGPSAQSQVVQGGKDLGAALRAILPKRN